MKLLDVVALLQDLPELGLIRGQVGTIVEIHPMYLKLNLSIKMGVFMRWKL
jgi:Domain of unknown function (DUF4926)